MCTQKGCGVNCGCWELADHCPAQLLCSAGALHLHPNPTERRGCVLVLFSDPFLFVHPPSGNFSWSGFVLVCGWACPSLRSSLNQGCTNTGGEKAQVRGNIKHSFCVEKKGLCSLSKVNPDLQGDEEKGICTSRSSHQ